MRTKLPQDACAPRMKCGFIATERNRYFTGKHMAARDFDCDQDYFVSRHRLHTRVMHGWGIVCGLGVVEHPRPECRKRWVVVRAGIAVDCCGRELIYPKDTAVELPLPNPAEEQAKPEPPLCNEAAPASSETAQTKDEMDVPFLICLCYGERGKEFVPALSAASTCDPQRREANRVIEEAEIRFVRLDDLEPGCWPSRKRRKTPCKDDCDEELPGPGGICLEPDCPCGQCVPLALIAPSEEGFDIDIKGRRQLPLPSEYLTKITSINWPHGGRLSLQKLRERRGRLEVRFSRKLMTASDEDDASGINPFTFVVRYGGVQETLEFLPYEEEAPPRLDEDRCTAVFTIDERYLGRKTTHRGGHHGKLPDIGGNMVFVTLKCDFILDCHDNPVDGNHLRGLLPSGNGVPGGIFESWFWIPEEAEGEESRGYMEDVAE